MPGNMPFHLEKGPLGLRMDYMAKVPAIRTEALRRLNNGDSPFAVGEALKVGTITISLFKDKRNEFAANLDAINGNAVVTTHLGTMTLGAAYLQRQSLLRPLNRDSTGNRDEFIQYWQDYRNRIQNLEDAVRDALIKALEQPDKELDVWWECTLPDNTDPDVAVDRKLDEVNRLMFRTDHRPIAPDTPGQVARQPDP